MEKIDTDISDVLAGKRLTQEQERELEEWLLESDGNRIFYEGLKSLRVGLEGYRNYSLGKLSVETVLKLVSAKRRRKKMLRYSAAAVAMLIVALSGVILVVNPENSLAEKSDPGSIPAPVVLTLSTGESVELDRNADRIVLADVDRTIVARENTLVYPSGHETGGQPILNKLTVPKGSEYILRLGDGSVIHLNSETEITYPVSPSGASREVHLDGEAYFEVESDPQTPFLVYVGDVVVRVTGTSFNVNAYRRNRTIAVTLEEGAVRFTHDATSRDIDPGQQVRFDKTTGQTELVRVNTELYTSWRNGHIFFENTSLEEIMASLASWYDLDIVYLDDRAKDLRFGGRFTRYEDIGYLLQKLGETGEVTFLIDGNTVTVGMK